MPRAPPPRQGAGALAQLHALLLQGGTPGNTNMVMGCCLLVIDGCVLVILCAAALLAGVPDGEDRTEPGDEL